MQCASVSDFQEWRCSAGRATLFAAFVLQFVFAIPALGSRVTIEYSASVTSINEIAEPCRFDFANCIDVLPGVIVGSTVTGRMSYDGARALFEPGIELGESFYRFQSTDAYFHSAFVQGMGRQYEFLSTSSQIYNSSIFVQDNNDGEDRIITETTEIALGAGTHIGLTEVVFADGTDALSLILQSSNLDALTSQALPSSSSFPGLDEFNLRGDFLLVLNGFDFQGNRRAVSVLARLDTLNVVVPAPTMAPIILAMLLAMVLQRQFTRRVTH